MDNDPQTDGLGAMRNAEAAPVSDLLDEALIIDIDGFEGPLDLLLALARTQKLDLMQISILALAEQYLAFIEKARALRIELAADYLVMAAWLAYLKSRLLLPPEPDAEDASAEDLAAHLAFQLERLDAMRNAAARLMARDRLGQDRFARGAPEAIIHKRNTQWETGLIDLMRAYARLRTRDEFRPLSLDRDAVFTMEQALGHMRGLIGYSGDWVTLESFLPPGWGAGKRRRSAMAACFAASLELARQGRIRLHQNGVFTPITLQRKGAGDER